MRWGKYLLSFFLFLLVGYYRYDIIAAFQVRVIKHNTDCSDLAAGTSTCFDSLSGCQKIWVHRVNSKERFELLQYRFAGVESDLVYKEGSNTFWVYHWGEGDTVLVVDELLKLSTVSNGFHWFDLTHSIEQDWRKELSALIHLDSLFRFKSRTLIETSNIPFANALSGLGYSVSYNPPLTIIKNKMKSDSARQLLTKEVKYLSQDVTYLSDLKNKFPDKKYLVWSLSFNNYFDFSKTSQLLNDTSIGVVLLNIKSRYYK
jgi:hypothetical protein